MKKQIALVAAALAALAVAAPALADNNLTPPPASKPTTTALSTAVTVTGTTTRSQSLLTLRVPVACNYGQIVTSAPYDPAAVDQWMYWVPTYESTGSLAGNAGYERIAVGALVAQRAGQHSYWIQRAGGGWDGPYSSVTSTYKPMLGGYPMVYRIVDFLRWTPNGVSTNWNSGPRVAGSYTGAAALSGNSCIYF